MRTTKHLGMILLSFAIVLAPVHASADNSDCAKNKAKLAQIEAAIAKLENTGSAARVAATLRDTLAVLIEALKATKGDLSKLTGPVNQAQKDLDDLAKRLKDAGSVVPPAVGALRKSLGSIAGQIESGIKKYKATPIGQIGGGLDAANKVIGQVTDVLEKVKAGLDAVAATDDAANGTGAEQIRAMKTMFDSVYKIMGGDESPIKPLLEAYSQALDGLATSVDAIEKAMKDKVNMAEQALQGTDFEGTANLYPGLQSGREKIAHELDALRAAEAALKQQLADAGCDTPPPPLQAPDPCETAQAVKKAVDGLTKKQQADYQAAEQKYEDALRALLNHAAAKPQVETADTSKLNAYASKLNQLQQAAATNDKSSYGSTNPLDSARAVASALGVSLPPATSFWRNDALNYVQILQDALAQQLVAAQQKAEADYQTKLQAWLSTNNQLVAAAKAALDERNAAKNTYDNAVGDALAKEAAAKGVSPARFDSCFPEEGKLRQRAANRSPTNPSTTGSTDSKKCPRSGGLVGGVDYVNCQIK